MSREQRTSVAIVYPVPMPYSFPVLELVAAADDLSVTVYYCRRELAGRGAPLDSVRLRFPHVFLPSAGFVSVRRDVRELDVNPTIPLALERGRHDIVVTSGFVQPTMLLAIAWARARRRAYGVMSESHGLRRRNLARAAVRDRIVGPIVRNASLLLATSGLAETELLRLGGLPDRISRFPHVPDPSVFRPPAPAERAAGRKRFGVAEGELLLAFVGRLVESKDVSTALRAVASLERPAKLVVVGEGPLAQQLREEASDCVVFTGFLAPEAVADLLRCADVLVLPSKDEPFGTIAIEAATCGCPVVASNAVPAARELAEDHGAALLFPVADVEALVRILSGLDGGQLADLRQATAAAAGAYTPAVAAQSFLDGVRRISVPG